MSKARLLVNCLALTVLTLGISSIANAQATRTWVSGVGDDANPCSRTAPCKTFAGAISKTAPSGEISVLDPGGFGAVNITKALTINGDGTLAAILNSGVTGIIVNAGANDVVYIRNISINGAGTGLNGIRYIAGKALHVENCNIYGQGNNTAGNGNGIIVALTATAGNVFVKDTNIKTCAVTGISVATTTGFVAGVLDNVRLEGLPTGAVIGNNAFVSIRNSLINLCTSTGVSITGSGTPTGSFDNVMINNNPTAINVGASGIINLSSSVLENNTTAIVSAAPQANLRSSGNNRLLGNVSDGAALQVILQK
ncbi:MAG TPA: hypothetical protein VL907_01790 [Pyrinomonadaceae bacterium]|jgi:hypothetical protein|nr:hypothetical protein [Pyrinomonadaceae bacterium]